MALEHDETSQEQESTGESDGGIDAGGIDGADDLNGVLGSGEGGGFVSEEKKPLSTGTIVMAGFLLACGVGTYLMYTRSAPANTPPSAATNAAQTTITQFLSDDKQNVSKMRDLLQNTEKAVEQFRAAPAKTQVPLEELQTNPFRTAGKNPDGTPTDEDEVAAKKKLEEARAATLKAAQALNLQFIVVGKKKSCLINNARYLEGQTVGDFTIESISPSSVIVKKDDQRFELKMKK